jgi:thiamine biosynthesis lipoprotein
MPRRPTACLLLAAALGLSACSRRELRKYEDSRTLMGTQVSIVVYCEDAQKAAAAMKAAFARVAELDLLMSKQRPDSEISRLNAAPSGRAKVSPDTFAVIDRALDYGKTTQGAFDVTVEPLLALWWKAEAEQSLPTAAAMKRALSLVGYDHIVLHPESSEVGFSRPGMRIDVGGIAKGYIVGQAVAALKAHGIGRALVTAGGDMFALGANPRRGGWLVGIRDPLKPEENIRYIEAADRAISTSGHYMRFYTVRGKKYSHIVDPRTGYPAGNDVVSVTIIGPDGTATDALTKSAAVLGPEKGLAIISAQPGVDALVMTWDGKKMEHFQTPGFAKYLRAP